MFWPIFWDSLKRNVKSSIAAYGVMCAVAAAVVFVYARYELMNEFIVLLAIGLWCFGLPIFFAVDLLFSTIRALIFYMHFREPPQRTFINTDSSSNVVFDDVTISDSSSTNKAE